MIKLLNLRRAFFKISFHFLIVVLLLEHVHESNAFTTCNHNQNHASNTLLLDHHYLSTQSSRIKTTKSSTISTLSLFQSPQQSQNDTIDDSNTPTTVINSVNNNNNNYDNNNNNPITTRAQAIFILLGGTAYINLALTVFQKIQRGENVYPLEHERRAADTFNIAISSALSNYNMVKDEVVVAVEEDGSLPSIGTNSNSNNGGDGQNNVVNHRPLRILEVGIGSSCRTIMRGTYDDALSSILHDKTMLYKEGIEFVGVDIDIPKDEKVIDNARNRFRSKLLVEGADRAVDSIPNTFDVRIGDVSKGLPFPDGYFDVVTTSLVLCSVEDQSQAIREIRRVLNPHGGTFGFIEHVAVNLENENEKDLAFLDWQQQKLDPLQQALAHNCHLHRSTDKEIESVFGDQARWLQMERFQVKDMWPVSCQSRGVIQLL